MRGLALCLLIAVGLCSCTQTPAESARAADAEAATQAKLAARLAGMVPGKPQTCVDEFQLRDAQVSSYGNTILHTLGNHTAYRSDTAGGCSDIGSTGHNILITKSSTGQLCSGDIATTVDDTSRIPTGSCGLGQFIRYSRP